MIFSTGSSPHPNLRRGRMLSQTAEYALRAVLYLAAQVEDEPVHVGVVAESLRIPRNYLSKILYRLVQAGVLTSVRGKGGGFTLAGPAHELSLLTIIAPFDRMDRRAECLLGRPACRDSAPCAAHARWRDVAGRVSDFFRETTAADLLGTTAQPR